MRLTVFAGPTKSCSKNRSELNVSPFFRVISLLHSIPIVFYDQIGNGESTHIKDKPADFWNPELFMDELDNLLKHLGIYENFDLLGHSWGGKPPNATSRISLS